MVLTNKYVAFLTAAVPVNSKYKYIMNLLPFTARTRNDRGWRLHSKESH